MLEAVLFSNQFQRTSEKVSGLLSRVKHKRMGAAILFFNGVIIIESLLYNYGLEQSREYSNSGRRCLTQAESDLIIEKHRNGNPLNEYLRVGAPIRLIYLSEGSENDAYKYRDTLRNQGHDVSAALSRGLAINGVVNECRVDWRIR